MALEHTTTGLKGMLGRITAPLRRGEHAPDTILDGSHAEQTGKSDVPRVEKPTPRLVTFEGMACVCNLEWLDKSETGFSISQPRGQARLIWGDLVATATGPEFEGQPALLELVASGLSPEERAITLMVVVAFPDRDLWFCAVLVNGEPALDQERLFDKKSDLIRHVSAEANSPAIARVLCSETLMEELNLIEPPKPLVVPQLDPRDFASFKRQAPIVSKPVVYGLGGIAGVCGLFILTNSYVLPWLFPAPPLHSETPMMSYVEDYGVFAIGCEAAFATPWPTAPGWSLEREGCATKGMNDPEVSAALKEPAAAYQVFTLKPQHNAILARRTAERVYADYPHQAVVDRGKLVIFKPFPITLAERPDLRAERKAAKPSNTQASLLHRAEDAFLGIEAGIKASSSSVGGKAFPKIEITTPASLSEVLRRIATLKKVSLSQLHRKNGLIEIALTSPRIILRPMQSTSEGNS